MSLRSHDQILEQRLRSYGRSGVHLGLDRIRQLLATLGSPQQQVPIIHVAGTNGKGSVCAYLSSVLTAAGYRVGRYTSPHLVSWCERICVNEQPITPTAFDQTLAQVEAAIAPESDPPTLFEVVTAAAWLYFAQQSVDVAVMEVGLGGRLDATNVVDQPLVSVITSLSREHWQVLGPTLADIAREKAGILKPQCPVVLGPLPQAAATVVQARAQALACPVVCPAPAQPTPEGKALYQDGTGNSIEYPVPFAGAHQLTNSALAIAALQVLRQQGWSIPEAAIQTGMARARWPGRLQWLHWQAPDGRPYRWLLDGAHNPAAAKVLRQYIETLAPTSVTWLMGMLSSKDHSDIFQELLRPGDRLHLVPVPGHACVAPAELHTLALQVCPQLDACIPHTTLATGLAAASSEPSPLRVLCGSLYLIGHFLDTQTVQADPQLAAASQ